MSETEIIADGLAVAFTIETAQGNVRLHVPAGDLGNIVAFFVGIAKAYEEKLGDTAGPAGQPSNFTPVPARGLGLATSDSPDVTNLVVRLYGFDLGFEIPTSELATQGRAMLAASAAGSKQ